MPTKKDSSDSSEAIKIALNAVSLAFKSLRIENARVNVRARELAGKKVVHLAGPVSDQYVAEEALDKAIWTLKLKVYGDEYGERVKKLLPRSLR